MSSADHWCFDSLVAAACVYRTGRYCEHNGNYPYKWFLKGVIFTEFVSFMKINLIWYKM